MTLLTLVLALVAFALFGAAMPAHHLRRLGRPLCPVLQRRLRLVAWLAVTASFTAALMARGGAFGPSLWVGALMLAAGVVFLSLNLLPARWSRTARRN